MQNNPNEAQAKPGPTIPPQAPPPPKSNFLKYAVIIIIVAGLVAGAYTAGTKGYKISIVTPTAQPVLLPTTIPATVQPTSAKPTAQAPTINETKNVIADANAGNCTLQAGAKSNLQNFAGKNICFLTAKKGSAAVPPENILASEAGPKIYVYPQSMQAQSGQWVETFPKDAGDTLEQAITKRFLAGINPAQCFVKILPNGNYPANFVKASISYPPPADPNAAFWEAGENCPQGYSQSNGIAYFLMDKDHPDSFFYFSIGQYGIEAETGNQNRMWQDTVQVY